MRNIKFRAWDSEEMYLSGKCSNHDLGNWFDAHSDCWTRNKDSLIMQFTGLHDKNGKEIYEGDIVNLKEYMRSSDVRPAVVICESLGYIYLKACDNGEGYGSLHIDEVIGNIHENPELLEAKP